MTRRFACIAWLTLLLGLTGCSAATAPPEDQEQDSEEPSDPGAVALAVGSTVEDAVSGSCSTTSVKGLSEQIVAQMNCLIPGALAEVPERPGLEFGPATFPFLQTPARDALVTALDAHPGSTLTVNSMLRTVAQQYVLYRWAAKGRCGITIAASPGKSNHESGLALDLSQYGTWRPRLTGQGFHWFGNGDKVHFDFAGSGKQNLRGVDVEAFQILWNLNNPSDSIEEDGSYGPKTAARLAKAPANGFPIGASCATDG